MRESRFNERSLVKPKVPQKRCFGTAERFSQPSKSRVGPGSYTIPTVFDIKKFKNQGCRLLSSQEVTFPNCTPGIGAYNLAESLYTYQYSFPKSSRVKSAKIGNPYPAPNSYNQTISTHLSKYKRCQLMVNMDQRL